MRRLVPFVILAALITAVAARGEEESAEREDSAPFPASWAGVWTGPCRSGPPPSGDKIVFPMELHVAPIDGREAWTWTIVYGEGDKRQVRPYELVPVDAKKHHWKIDEKNGIAIDAWFVDDTLYSRFGVLGNRIEAHYRRDGDSIDVTLTTFKGVATKSGGEGRVPEVNAGRLIGVQRGKLTRRR